MRDQFRLLLALQQVDDRLRALALQEQQLPQRLQAYEAVCAAARQQLVQQQAAIEQSERQQRVFERQRARLCGPRERDRALAAAGGDERCTQRKRGELVGFVH